jgi:integrase/recombinase XerD
MAVAQEIDICQDFAADGRTRGLASKSIRVYLGYVRELERFLETRGKELTQADRLDIRDHIEELRAKGDKTKTIRVHLAGISSFYEWLIFEGKIQVNPAREVRQRLQRYKTDGEEETHKIVSVQEAAALVQAMVDIRDKALILLLLKTGIRKGELVSLDMDDISWRDNSITLKPTAKRSNRIVFFDEEAAYYLRRWLAVRDGRRGSDGPALFLSSRGSRLQGGGVDNIVRRGALLAGLHDLESDRLDQHFSPHSARHFFTTHLLKAGMKREYVQWLRGDAIKEAVDIYFHISPEDVRKQYLAYIPQLGV